MLALFIIVPNPIILSFSLYVKIFFSALVTQTVMSITESCQMCLANTDLMNSFYHKNLNMSTVLFRPFLI